MHFVALIFGGLLLAYLALSKSQGKKRKVDYMAEFEKTLVVHSMTHQEQAIDLRSLSDQTLKQRLERWFTNIKRQLGSMAIVKIVGFIVVIAIAAININNLFIRGPVLVVIPIIEVASLVFAIVWLQGRERKQFEESFPDALNMLTSAVSSGESIMHAIMFVGKSLEGEVGKEFKLMGERLQMGESPDTVFRKSCARFPYPTFHFFVITLRANLRRGGQLKEIMSRLNRLMFDARSIEKKKFALTSEARASAKIVCAIPFFFLFMLQFLSPDNYEFIMFHPEGRPILYYVLISEGIGMFIIWSLMKGVR